MPLVLFAVAPAELLRQTGFCTSPQPCMRQHHEAWMASDRGYDSVPDGRAGSSGAPSDNTHELNFQQWAVEGRTCRLRRSALALVIARICARQHTRSAGPIVREAFFGSRPKPPILRPALDRLRANGAASASVSSDITVLHSAAGAASGEFGAGGWASGRAGLPRTSATSHAAVRPPGVGSNGMQRVQVGVVVAITVSRRASAASRCRRALPA
jgi:hypothetical protein